MCNGRVHRHGGVGLVCEFERGVMGEMYLLGCGGLHGRM
jgi:hypothetical protein